MSDELCQYRLTNVHGVKSKRYNTDLHYIIAAFIHNHFFANGTSNILLRLIRQKETEGYSFRFSTMESII